MHKHNSNSVVDVWLSRAVDNMLGNEAIHGTPGFVTWECDAMTAMF